MEKLHHLKNHFLDSQTLREIENQFHPFSPEQLLESIKTIDSGFRLGNQTTTRIQKIVQRSFYETKVVRKSGLSIPLINTKIKETDIGLMPSNYETYGEQIGRINLEKGILVYCSRKPTEYRAIQLLIPKQVDLTRFNPTSDEVLLDDMLDQDELSTIRNRPKPKTITKLPVMKVNYVIQDYRPESDTSETHRIDQKRIFKVLNGFLAFGWTEKDANFKDIIKDTYFKNF